MNNPMGMFQNLHGSVQQATSGPRDWLLELQYNPDTDYSSQWGGLYNAGNEGDLYYGGGANKNWMHAMDSRYKGRGAGSNAFGYYELSASNMDRDQFKQLTRRNNVIESMLRAGYSMNQVKDHMDGRRDITKEDPEHDPKAEGFKWFNDGSDDTYGTPQEPPSTGGAGPGFLDGWGTGTPNTPTPPPSDPTGPRSNYVRDKSFLAGYNKERQNRNGMMGGNQTPSFAPPEVGDGGMMGDYMKPSLPSPGGHPPGGSGPGFSQPPSKGPTYAPPRPMGPAEAAYREQAKPRESVVKSMFKDIMP